MTHREWTSPDGRIRLINADCLEVLRAMPASSVDAVVTSPPYAMQRAKQYGGIPEEEYPAWFSGVMGALLRVADVSASVLVNIREHVRNGEMADYLHKTRLEVRQSGWIECDELIWLKRNAMPVGDNRRPRRAWERVLWFSQSRHPRFNAYANGKQSNRGRWSGKPTEWSGNGRAKPEGGLSRSTDVADIALPGETTGHPAAYPSALAEWLVRFSDGVNVCDPFAGSFTTAIACIRTGRRCIAIEKEPRYFDIGVQRCEAEYAKAQEQVA